MPFDPVYKLVKQIPRGRVLTYGALAKALRLPGGARTAGRAMGATPKGKGIPVVESRINMKKHLWTPPRKKSSAAKKIRKSTASQ